MKGNEFFSASRIRMGLIRLIRRISFIFLVQRRLIVAEYRSRRKARCPRLALDRRHLLRILVHRHKNWNHQDWSHVIFADASRISLYHRYSDVIMTTIASQITSLTIVYSTVYSGADQSKHQSPASLAFVWGIHRGPVNSPHKWPVTRKMFPFDDVIMTMIVLFLGCKNPLAVQQHNETIGHDHCSLMGWLWTHQQISDETGEDGSNLLPVFQPVVVLMMIKS